jgi:phage tail tape-measure protein
MSKFVLTAQLQLQAPNNVAQVVRQIQSQLNNVSVNIQVQGAAQAQRQIQQVSQTTNDAASAAERMGKAFAVSIRRFAAFSIATRAVGLFTSTLSDSIKTAIDFERQLIKVSQVTGDSIGKLKTLTSTITKLSTDFGVSSQSLLDVSTILLQAGVSAKDTEVALKSLAKAA